MRNKYVYQFTNEELEFGFKSMELELRNLYVVHPIWILYKKAKKDFLAGKWKYDGATFVRERNYETIFEVAGFIHDWRNEMGYVSYDIDNELLDIMIYLNYPRKMIIKRWMLTRFTFLNIIRHRVMHTYLKKRPKFIFKLT